MSYKDLQKSLNKAKINTGIVNPDHWLSTGIYLLNATMTGSFLRAIPNRRSVLFWGESGTGKSFLASLIAKEAQDSGYHVIYIDTEFSIHDDYLRRIGVDIDDESKFTAITISTVQEATKVMASIYSSFSPEDKVCVIMDSLSNLETENDSKNFDKGELKGDQGQLAKQLKKFMKSVNAKIGHRDMYFVTTGHAYQNQDVLNGEGKWLFSGGKGVQFIPSISVLLTKLKLKDETEIVGVKIRTEITKSRFTKLGGKSEIELDYEKGFEPYSGMLELGVKGGLIKRNGAWYSYTNTNGEEVKFQKKDFGNHFDQIFDLKKYDIEPEEKYEVEELDGDSQED